MSVLILLLTIPLFCLSFALYLMTLLNFIMLNEMDFVILSFTICSIFIFSFISFKLLIKTSEDTSFRLLNMDNNFINIYGFFSFNIIGLFGISLLVNTFINLFNPLNFGFGFCIILWYLYILYTYIWDNKEEILTISYIESINKNIDLLYFDEDHCLYVRHNDIYQEEKKYLCKVNKMSKEIRKIIKESDDKDE